MHVGRWIAAGIGALIVVAVLAVGVWQLGWFVQEKNVNRAGQVAQQSYSRQVGTASRVSDLASTVADIDVQITTATPEQAVALRAQRHAVIGQMCDAAAQLNDTAQPSGSAQTLIAKECK